MSKFESIPSGKSNKTVEFMSDQLTGTSADEERVTLADLYASANTDTLRATIAHHSEVLTSDHASEEQRRLSWALVRLNALTDGGLGEVQAGNLSFGARDPSPRDNTLRGVRIPTGSLLPGASSDQVPSKFYNDMSPDERRLVLSKKFLDENPDLSVVDDITLSDLSPGYQELTLGRTLVEALNTSNDPERQRHASQRNADIVESGVYLHAGDLTHTASVSDLSSILSSGIVAGELIGEHSVSDSYPLNVDFFRVDSNDLEGSFYEQMRAATDGWYGDPSRSDRITFVIPNTYEFSQRAAISSDQFADHVLNHRLAFGAVPSTEIGTLVLNRDNTSESASNEMEVLSLILKQDTYIPVIDEAGQVLLTPEEFHYKRCQRLDQLTADGVQITPQSERVNVDESELELDDRSQEDEFELPDIGAF